MENENPSIYKTIKILIENSLSEIHVSLPAKVISFDGERASVQPLLKRKFKDEQPVDLPQLINVPVRFDQSINSGLSYPVPPETTGQLVFCERSLDKWLESGACVSPDDPRKFDLTDAVFYPGLKAFGVNNFYDPDRAIVKNGVTQITLNKNGKFKLENSTDEVLGIISDFIAEMQTATVNTAIGPQNFTATSIAEFLLIQQRIDNMRE